MYKITIVSLFMVLMTELAYAGGIDWKGQAYLQFSSVSSNVGSQMAINRLYLSGVGNVSNGINWQFALDAQVAGTTAYTMQLKYAYLEFMDLFQDGRLVVGKHPQPWVKYEEGLWRNRFVVEALSDRLNLMEDAGEGFGVEGYLLKDVIEYSASLVNGNGSYTAEADPFKDVEARVGWRGLKNVDVSVFYHGSNDQTTDIVYGGAGGYNVEQMGLNVELLMFDKVTKGMTLGAFGFYKLLPMVNVIANLDYTDPDSGVSNDDMITVITGGVIPYAKNIKLCANIRLTMTGGSLTNQGVYANAEVAF